MGGSGHACGLTISQERLSLMTEGALSLRVNELICVCFLARATRAATRRESRIGSGKFDLMGEIGREASPESARIAHRVVCSARRVHLAPVETFAGWLMADKPSGEIDTLL